jgi:hypothetical protein
MISDSEARLRELEYRLGEIERIAREKAETIGWMEQNVKLSPPDPVGESTPPPPSPLTGRVCVTVKGLQSGLPVEGVGVEVVRPNGTVLDSGSTDIEGRFCSGYHSISILYRIRITAAFPWGGTYTRTFGTWYFVEGTTEREYGICAARITWTVTSSNGGPVTNAAVPPLQNYGCPGTTHPTVQDPPGTYTIPTSWIVPLPNGDCEFPFTMNYWTVWSSNPWEICTEHQNYLSCCGTDPIEVNCGDSLTKSVVLQALKPDWLPLLCGPYECFEGYTGCGLEGRAISTELFLTVLETAPETIFGTLLGSPIPVSWTGCPLPRGGYQYDSECIGGQFLEYWCWREVLYYGTFWIRDEEPTVHYHTSARVRVSVGGYAASAFFSFWKGSGCSNEPLCPPDTPTTRYKVYIPTPFTLGAACYNTLTSLNISPGAFGTGTTIRLGTYGSFPGTHPCHPTYVPLGPAYVRYDSGCWPPPIHAELTE